MRCTTKGKRVSKTSCTRNRKRQRFGKLRPILPKENATMCSQLWWKRLEKSQTIRLSPESFRLWRQSLRRKSTPRLRRRRTKMPRWMKNRRSPPWQTSTKNMPSHSNLRSISALFFSSLRSSPPWFWKCARWRISLALTNLSSKANSRTSSLEKLSSSLRMPTLAWTKRCRTCLKVSHPTSTDC